MNASSKLDAYQAALKRITRQDRRFPFALEADYVNIDDQDLLQMLAYTQELSRLFVFVHDDLQQNTSWQTLFSDNELMVIAQVAQFCRYYLQQELVLKPLAKMDKKRAQILKFAVQLDDWLVALRNIPSAISRNMQATITQSIVDPLRHELRKIAGHVLTADNEQISSVSLTKLSSLWGLDDLLLESQASASLEGLAFANTYKDDEQIDTVYYAFTGQLSFISKACMTHTQALLDSQSHQPAVSMFITFLRLYDQVRDKINTFNQRHLDYYYFDVLGMNSDYQTDYVAYLQLHTSSKKMHVDINSSNTFSATDNSGQELQFVPQGYCCASDCCVASIQHLNIEKDPLISPQYLFAHSTNISLRPRLQSGKDSYESTAWPLFGAKQGFYDAQPRQDAELGFAIACQDLSLAQGQREIVFVLTLHTKSQTVNISNRLQSLSERLQQHVGQQQALQRACLVSCFDDLKQSLQLFLHRTSESVLSDIDDEEINAFFEQPLPQQIERCVYFYIFQRLKIESSQAQCADLIGVLVALQVCSEDDVISANEFAEFQQTLSNMVAQERLSLSQQQTVLCMLRGHAPYTHDKLLSDTLVCHLTGNTGWIRADKQSIKKLPVEAGQCRLQITLEFDVSAPSIIDFDASIHSGDFVTALPICQFILNAQADYFAFDLFKHFGLASTSITTKASEISALFVANQFGRLELGSSVQMFGASPNQHSYFQVGYAEAARKTVSRYRLTLHYTDLPREKLGFAAHYQEYDADFDNTVFTLCLRYGANGEFTTLDTVPMFTSDLHTQTVKAKRVYDFYSQQGFAPITTNIADTEYANANNAVNGYLRLSLEGPEYAFGHDLYPHQLTQTLMFNSKVKAHKQRAMPNPPYTPKIEKISLAYEAHTHIDYFYHAQDQHTKLHAFFHVSRLHITPISFDNLRKPPSLLPEFIADANLIVGLQSAEPLSTVSLYFDLQDDCCLDIERAAPAVLISTYTSDGWVVLPRTDILFDSTDVLSTRGVVTIRLPNHIRLKKMPDGTEQYCLMLSTREQHDLFASVLSVKANVIPMKARHQKYFSPTNLRFSLPQTLQGVISSHLVSPIHHNNIDKVKRQVICATSERLRHKNSPVTPADFEQIVLQEFDQIYMAKCLPHTSQHSVNALQKKFIFAPGYITVVVLPYAQPGQGYTDAVRANSVILKKIQRRLQHLAPRFTHIEVCNPIYERIQVRCSVKFVDEQQAGKLSTELNQHISRYFDPYDASKRSQLFAWQLSCEEMRAHIQNHPSVLHVTNFSILHISQRSPRVYEIQDTVSMQQEGKTIIQSIYPWCLPLPDKQHVIDLIDEQYIEQANVTGINEMEVGNNFILGA